jgi:lipid A ethanolaminephosphotransferase
MKRLQLYPEALVLLTAVILAVFYNGPLWSRVTAIHPGATPGDVLFLASWFVFLVAFMNFFFVATAFRIAVKPVMLTLLLIAAVNHYFMTEYGVVINTEMVQNVFETDSREAFEYLNMDLVAAIVLSGLLPVLLLGLVPVKARTLPRQFTVNLASMAVSIAAIGLVAYAFFPDYASLFRNDRQLRLLANPTSSIHSVMNYFHDRYSGDPDVSISPIASDVTKSPQWQNHRRHTLVVLVAGETARADSFSLDGYARPTNPLLANDDIINFTQVTSCGTATATSLPCLFSPLSREDYSDAAGKGSESLLDVLQRAGLSVVWRDNNSGCKGTCDRVEYENLSHLALPEYCKSDGECFDEVLLEELRNLVAAHPGDLAVVLHQKGSHGPAYFQRVPEAFEKFTPSCHSSQLTACDRQAIINAYDNTILYTDWVLDKTIKLLQREFTDMDTALVYVSDHGESLGENNLYLHGAPYFVAPREQTHVPMLAWISENYRTDFSIDLECVRNERELPLSHDNFFHSVLGMLQLNTKVYDPDLDIFAPCQGNLVVKHAVTPKNSNAGRQG